MIVPRTLYAKLSIALAVLLASIGAMYSVIGLSAARLHLQEVDQALNRDLARNLVADRNLVAQGRLDEKALQDTFDEYMTINPSIEIYLLDLQGRILSCSADPGKVKRNGVSLEPIRRFLAGDDSYPLLGDDPRSHDRRKAFSVTPVPSATSPEGYLYVVLRGEMYDSVETLMQSSYLFRLSGWTLAGSLALGLLVGLLVFRLLTRRMHRLARLMERFRDSGFTRHETFHRGAADSGGDEIDRLGATYDAMAERIEAQIQALRDTDASRRDLVAKVSHDLRTPLAALSGYLETLKLKDRELGPRERAAHLAVALHQSERLTALVDQLFQLAKLEAREEQPRCEPFSIADLVQDVVLRFRLRAEESGTSLDVRVDGDMPLVSGDVGLIERVLANLIDNALEHTPAGGSVEVPLRADVSGVRVCVADTGAGIPADELPLVFERFHRAGGRGSDAGHAGLGLAIAKRIVDLHGSALEVSSDPGRGTTFSFVLPAAA